MAWILAFHIIFVTCWFAGLFYLPRLFVYHAMAEDSISIERFKMMERKLYYGIMTPSAILAIFFGAWLVQFNPSYYIHSTWFVIKLIGVMLLVIYHLYCGHLRMCFAHDENEHGHIFYRWLNEVPVLLLFLIVIMVVVRPFS